MTARLTPRVSRAAALALAVAVPVGLVRAQGPDLGTDAQRQAGQQLYQKYCAQCHGDKGNGDGYATPHLLPKPRDFTSGKYKVRSTPTGALPTHQDLVSVIRRGMPYTSMPAWPDLTDDDLSALAYYVKSFAPDFANPDAVPQPVPLPGAPAATAESIATGKKLYEETGCIRCHGTLGRGDGPSAPTLVDDLKHPIRAANLAQSWTFRGGASREDIFRTMSTGFNGTPMPGFVDALTEEQRWAITDYIVSLSGTTGPGYTNLVVAKYVVDPIDLSKGAANFHAAAAARFPIVGQIMEPGRAFHPPASSVTVQAIYDTESIAILVRWHDMLADRTGKAGPSLPVPPEEEAAASPAVAAAGAAAAPADVDPFADPGAAPTTVAPSEFNDAVAIQVPAQVPAGARKPYFIFGDPQNPVDLWFFDLGTAGPQQFIGRGSADLAANDTGSLTGIASYDQGEWSVMFTRPLRPAAGAPFTPGEFMPIAFTVWDGFSRERGNRRALSVWYSLYLEPEHVPSAAGPMLRTGLLVLVLELIVIGWVRRRAPGLPGFREEFDVQEHLRPRRQL
jgi:DMSO reductase family type II enzyme heme b subunit